MIIITGASKGIGKYLFDAFKKDQKVIGTFNTTKSELKNEDMFQVDISDQNSVREWVRSIGLKSENIILINCAGINYNSLAHKVDIDEWVKVIQTNLIGTFFVINAFLPYMRDSGFGRIINISSVVSKLGIPGTSAYASSKSGLSGLMRVISSENARRGITVNNINLGYFDIGMIEQIPINILEGLVEKIPQKRLGVPEEILSTVKYIIETDYLTGTSIDINGGLI